MDKYIPGGSSTRRSACSGRWRGRLGQDQGMAPDRGVRPLVLLADPVADTAMDIAGAAGAERASTAAECHGPTSGKITLLDSKLEEIASWELQNVAAERVEGPQLRRQRQGRRDRDARARARRVPAVLERLKIFEWHKPYMFVLFDHNPEQLKVTPPRPERRPDSQPSTPRHRARQCPPLRPAERAAATARRRADRDHDHEGAARRCRRPS